MPHTWLCTHANCYCVNYHWLTVNIIIVIIKFISLGNTVYCNSVTIIFIFDNTIQFNQIVCMLSTISCSTSNDNSTGGCGCSSGMCVKILWNTICWNWYYYYYYYYTLAVLKEARAGILRVARRIWKANGYRVSHLVSLKLKLCCGILNIIHVSRLK